MLSGESARPTSTLLHVWGLAGRTLRSSGLMLSCLVECTEQKRLQKQTHRTAKFKEVGQNFRSEGP